MQVEVVEASNPEVEEEDILEEAVVIDQVEVEHLLELGLQSSTRLAS